MRTARLLGLVRGNLARGLRALVLSASGVALGVGCLVFFLALGAGLEGVVSAVFPASSREVEVVLPQPGLGTLLGGVRKLDDAALTQLAALPGVDRAFPKMSLRIPAVTRYNGLFFGKEIRMGLEVIGVGVPPELIGTDARLPFVDPGEDPQKPIPVVVNRRLLEIYNKVFAPQRGLPKLTDSMISGFVFPVELGRSYLAANTMTNPYQSSLQLAGLSDRTTLAGVTLPLATVQRLNRRFGQDGSSYSSVLLRVRSSEEVPAVAAAIKRAGFELDESERNRALQIGAAVRLVALAFSLLSGLITALAAVNIAQAYHASVRERRREIGVLRAVGATRLDVQRLILAEAAATGLCGGAAGLVLSRLAGLLVDWVARTRLPDFPFKPETFFHFALWMYLVGAGVALLAALLGALLPARAAAHLDPARALSEG